MTRTPAMPTAHALAACRRDVRDRVLAMAFTCLAAGSGAPALAQAQDDAIKAKAEQVCSGCHGAHGNPLAPQIPILSGQTARYLYLELRDFKVGRRNDPIMAPIAEGLSKEEMLGLADYFAAQAPVGAEFETDRARVIKGAKKADETLCTMCHLGGLKGQNEIPRLAGQQPEYVLKQLRAFKARQRTNDGGNMQSVAQTLSDEDILNLTHYVADLR
jgi:cytochrome c553